MADLKSNFFKIYGWVRHGLKVTITIGKNIKIIAYLMPALVGKNTKRPLGLLSGKAKVTFGDDFKISEETFLGM